MAAGSNSGWHGLPKQHRVCASCGRVLTLKNSVWHAESERTLDGWWRVFCGVSCWRAVFLRELGVAA